MRAVSPCRTTRGSHRLDHAPARPLEQRVGGLERAELLERLHRREHEHDLVARVGLQRAGGREPAEVDRLGAVGLGRRVLGHGGEEEVRVEADRHRLRRDPARELHQRGRVAQHDAGLLGDLAHAGGTVRGIAHALAGVDRAAREHPGAAHEALGGVALDQQHLEALAAAAEQDHRGRLAGGRGLAAVQLGAGLRASLQLSPRTARSRPCGRRRPGRTSRSGCRRRPCRRGCRRRGRPRRGRR